MPQTSISAWLNKPKSVLEPPAAAATAPQAPTTPPPAKLAPTSAQMEPRSPSKQGGQSSINDAAPQPLSPAPKLTRQPPAFAALPPLPPNVEFVPASAALMPSFRRLNALLLPIPYSPRFYEEILSDPETANLTILALWHPSPHPPPLATPDTSTGTSSNTTVPPARQQHPPPILVAGIRCRILRAPTDQSSSSSSSPQQPTLYLSTLVCLSTHRRHGIATHLLAAATRRAVASHGVAAVAAHVWAANDEALGWYRRRGFAEVGRVEGYYRRLRPGTAVLVRKEVGVGDLVGACEGG